MEHITEEERDDLLAKYDDALQWIAEKIAEQESKSITEDPAFTQDEVDKKVNKIVESFMKLQTKPKPKKPKQKKTENEEKAKTEESDAKAEEDSTNADADTEKAETTKEQDAEAGEPEMATDEL